MRGGCSCDRIVSTGGEDIRNVAESVVLSGSREMGSVNLCISFESAGSFEISK